MRVITGIARGTRLKSFEGDNVRPTTDKVKEAIFSSIHFVVEGSKVLDLFAGTGQLGIEALSRGANEAFFIDSSKDSIKLVEQNLNLSKLKDSKIKIINEDSILFLKTNTEKFDFVFVDPPYRKGIISQVLENIENSLNDNAYIFCEHEKELELPEKIGNLNLRKTYKYGKIYVSLYRYFCLESDEI